MLRLFLTATAAVVGHALSAATDNRASSAAAVNERDASLKASDAALEELARLREGLALQDKHVSSKGPVRGLTYAVLPDAPSRAGASRMVASQKETTAGASGTFVVYNSPTKTWADAKADCESRGLELAYILSESENDELKESAGTAKVWIGATDGESEGAWSTWAVGEAMSYANWNIGEPNDSGGEDCAMMFGSNGLWNDAACSRTLAYACRAESPPFLCQAGRGESGGSYASGDFGDNSRAACAAVCDGSNDCVAFDVANTDKANACRLYAANTEPRLGDGGADNRQYCQSTTRSACRAVVCDSDKVTLTAARTMGCTSITKTLVAEGESGDITLGCLQTVSNINIYNQDALASLSFPLLARAGSISLDSNTYLTSLSLPRLTDVNSLRFEFNLLRSLSMPLVANVGYLGFYYGRDELTSLSLPLLTNLGQLTIDYTRIASISFPKLANVEGSISILASDSITSLSLPLLTDVGISLSLPKLTNIGDSLGIYSNHRLTSLSLPLLANALANTCRAESPPYLCQTGQGQYGASNDGGDFGDKVLCAAACDGSDTCAAFDFASTGKANACRLYAANAAPRLGDGGADNRQYCQSTTRS
ncbi:hypothetical protein EMIHUDRAFT_250374 [Emiliania huxleyi CCMP1516]|uniref:C-type lectin domain-containing protein n=2 Tax=Emiliania huxleyi TaxID=2903 RepID=A0A0D3I0Y7_EMIH1|nr:hypothetical protein EMIHUDRAFT_250374 [Emiliania huxleyi CCMP1516]EOD04922.1 hypothetical protein EMIHUDRAFT_250374 [Emiliania huxleyi CCMP1516]|eukprot:XP_005757351.1 hypothetical protein EMIHUDRAFT_250374 [Emiliania huxleyi CCMP1516]